MRHVGVRTLRTSTDHRIAQLKNNASRDARHSWKLRKPLEKGERTNGTFANAWTIVSRRKKSIGVNDMDREVAQIVATTASRVASELASLVPFLKEYGDGLKDDAVRQAIASAVYEVGSVREAVFHEYPDLKAEFEARLNKYGRSSY